MGRFMIGDWVLGLIRLGITIVAMFCSILMITYSALGIIYGLLWLVDMFLVNFVFVASEV
ncbi:hypothetical protein A0M79_04000 [Campylobacter jejuni]|nr:hypothetical protein A0M79_04000 [Campylobacter jejuni]